jgi:hypothetical protein
MTIFPEADPGRAGAQFGYQQVVFTVVLGFSHCDLRFI